MQYDYIIIGAGSAGCTLANRLGEDTSKQILVLEAGPMDRDLFIHIPAGVYRVYKDPKINWNYETAPEAQLNNRQVPMPRGKVVGGSSSINSMVYMRGHPLDYDGWAQADGMGHWRYADCLPYFKAGESYSRGGDAYRGADGPLGVTRGSYENPLYDAFIESGAQAGQGHSEDLNGQNPEGVARFDATKRDGRRCSAAVAHLRPALKRGNVTLVTSAFVQRVIIEEGRARGVEYKHRGQTIRADAEETLLSGGALNSPQLLLLSGVGPSDHLEALGIEPRVHLPGVGQNLMDHPSFIMQFESRKAFPIHKVDQPLRKLAAGVRWVFARDGVAASNIWEAGGLIKGDDSAPFPNLQYHMGPVGFEYTGRKISLMQAFAIHVDLLRPRSRGRVELASADPGQAPRMIFDYMSDAEDLRELAQGVHKVRDLVSQPGFDALRGVELIPGPNVRSDAEIEAWLRTAIETDYHPCGTCKMGTGLDAVVTPEFKVHGVEGLRVVDASTMPAITSANLNAPTQMMAARAADFIAGRPQKPAEVTPFAFESVT